MHRRILFASLIMIITLACGGTTVTPTFTPLPTQTNTPIPISSPTPTPVVMKLTIIDKIVNCRYGPSTAYELINELHEGEVTRATGRDESASWWYIRDPGNPDGFCWVSGTVTQLDGDGQKLPLVPAPPAAVTNVDLVVEPNRMVVDCLEFPQTFFFEANITTNGPALVTWKWEASTGVSSDVGTIAFGEAATQPINEFYRVNSPNDYWVKLYILTPNQIEKQVNFRVECSP